MVIIRGHHLAIRVQDMELPPLQIVMMTANWIGEFKNVFPTVDLTRIVLLKIDAQMKNVFHSTQTVEHTRIAILMRNAMMKNVVFKLVRTQLQHVRVRLFTRNPNTPKIRLF